jgi:biopolymer transport protein TolR
MAMSVGGKKGGVMSEINVTPMADIMIVLLIIFMVITPMLQKGVDVKLPKASNSDEKPDSQKTVVVAVKKDMTLYLGGKRLDNGESELKPLLQAKVDELPDTDKVVFLKADIELPYSEVMKVMDWCREAGAEEVALIVEKKVQS